MSSGKISEDEKGDLISILSPVGIHQLDENIAIIVKDPLRALAIAFLSSPLLAQTKDVLSMTISGTIPYSIVRLVKLKDFFGIGGLTLISALLAVLALIYWCNPKHRRKIRL